MNFEQRALCFPCQGSYLYGILGAPQSASSRGVLIVVGGPQYRVGSHRQFALLASYLAQHGVPAMRFDYRGMGDSEGDMRNFENVEDDIRCAVDEFFKEVPGLKEVVIWGLCDAASAALFYAHKDARVSGLVLLNPWARTDQGMAKAYLKHYYLGRLLDRELWMKVLRGRFDYRSAIGSALSMVGKALPGKQKELTAEGALDSGQSANPVPLPDRMFEGLQRFQGKVLLIMSGNDLTAQEFSDLVQRSRKWKKLLASPRMQRRDLVDANHTFSRREWRDQVAVWTREWLTAW